jgi:glycosyltransferase involved in cell wall biosynthesis
VNGQTGLLVDAGDVDAFAAAAARLIEDRNLRRSMGERGRLRVAALFTQKQHMTVIERIYSELCNEPAQPAEAASARTVERLRSTVTRSL